MHARPSPRGRRVGGPAPACTGSARQAFVGGPCGAGFYGKDRNPRSGCQPLVTMMQATDLGKGDDLPVPRQNLVRRTNLRIFGGMMLSFAYTQDGVLVGRRGFDEGQVLSGGLGVIKSLADDGIEVKVHASMRAQAKGKGKPRSRPAGRTGGWGCGRQWP